MKTKLTLFAFMLAFCMQTSVVYADDGDMPLFLNAKTGPKIGGNAGPRRAPARPAYLDMDIYLNEDIRCLKLFSAEPTTITYYIYNWDDEEVADGTLTFTGQAEAVVSLATLPEGIYFLEIVQDGTTYVGEFVLE